MINSAIIDILEKDDIQRFEEYLKERDDMDQVIDNSLLFTNPTIKTDSSVLPLFNCASLASCTALFGALKCFNYLANCGANLTAIDEIGGFPALYASYSGSVEILDILDSFSADLSTMTTLRMIGCYHIAAHFGHLNLVQRFWQRGFSVYEKDYQRMNPVHHSAFNSNSDVIRFFGSKGFKLNTKSCLGTPFLIAVQNNSIEVVKYLIEQKINVDQFISEEETALMHSIRKGFDGVAECIIQETQNIDQKSNEGWTALHFAAYFGRFSICKLLIKNDANVNSTTLFGATPLLLSRNNRHDEISKYLETEGASLKTNEGEFVFPPII